MRKKQTKKIEKTARFTKRKHYATGYKNTCQKTHHFKSFEEAKVAADIYNKRVLFAYMNAYLCTRHPSWHIGHNNKHRFQQDKLKWDYYE